jgi:aminoglycoside phosphotransferase (APT) family kinase protein
MRHSQPPRGSDDGHGSGRNVLLDTNWRPRSDELANRLRAWVRSHLDEVTEVGKIEFPEEGGSSLNLSFEVLRADGSTRAYVARLGSVEPSRRTFPDESLAREVRYLRALGAKTTVPVPEVVSYEDDPQPLGAPFLVMPRLTGRPWPSDPPYTFGGWVTERSASERDAMQHSLLRILADVHSVRADEVDLTGVERPGQGANALHSQVAYLRHMYDWGCDGRGFPLVDTALDRLAASIPTRRDAPCVTWGDARPGNVLFEGVDPRAVLDWEGAAPGYPEIDLAFACMMHRYYQGRAEVAGLPGLPTLFRPSDVADQYAQITGRPVAPLEWYLVLAAVRAAVVQVRAATRAAALGGQPIDERDPDANLPIRPTLRSALAAI